MIPARGGQVRFGAYTTSAEKKMLHNSRPQLSADDMECLWAIARRAAIQDRWVHVRGKQLEDFGLIVISDGWPVLTTAGRTLLDDLSTRMILDLYREVGTDSGKS